MSSIEPNNTLYLGDIHLGGFDEATNARLEEDAASLVRHCTRNGIGLVLTGDIFDYWMDYPDRSPDIGQTFRRAVQAHAARFGPVPMVTGNHDNWMLGRLRDEGFSPVSEKLLRSAGARRVLIVHGDGLTDPSLRHPRPFWHRFIRHPAFYRLYRMLPFDTALGLMKWFSARQRANAPQPEDTEPLDRWAAYALDLGLCDVLIAGHHHETRHRHLAGGEYLNTGAFYRTRTAVLHTNTGFGLVVWNTAAHRLDPLHD